MKAYFAYILISGLSMLLFFVLYKTDMRASAHYMQTGRELPEEAYHGTILTGCAGCRDATIVSNKTVSAHTGLNNIRLPVELENRYRDAEYIGKGATAHVFKAIRRADGKTVAVKVPIAFDSSTGEHFMREMKIREGLCHSNMVEIFSLDIRPFPYVEMECLDKSLAEFEKPVDFRRAAQIITGVAKGLGYAHREGVIHRDIKPQNIMMNGESTPKITDWGLGVNIDDAAETTTFGFSPNYASPEQIEPDRYGGIDTRTDIYQLGVVFYELLTGRVPFRGVAAVPEEEPAAPLAIQSGLEPFDLIIKKCLQKEPCKRYQTMEEFLLDLENVRFCSCEPVVFHS